MLETSSFVEDKHPLLPHFSLEAYAAFVESPKPPQIVADLNEGDDDAISVDVNPCSFNAPTQQDACDLPVFCPAGDIGPSAGELGDYHWIGIGPLDWRRIPSQ